MKRNTFKGLFGGVVLGALLAACGPISETRAPDDEHTPVTALHTRPEPFPDPRPLARLGPAVAYGGGKYLAAWWDVRDGGVYATRVKPDGTQLDPEGIRLNVGTGEGGPPTLAYDGKHFMVVWETRDGFSGVRVTPDGRVLGPVFDIITSDEVFGPAGLACSPEIVFAGSDVEDERAPHYILGARVSHDARVLDPSILTRSSEPPLPTARVDPTPALD